MIREIQLRNFKGFERFKIRFGERAVLVGPNNAGKSTAIGSVRAIAGMRRRASREVARRYVHDAGMPRRAWSTPAGYGLSEENLRYDFLPRDVRITALFGG